MVPYGRSPLYIGEFRARAALESLSKSKSKDIYYSAKYHFWVVQADPPHRVGIIISARIHKDPLLLWRVSRRKGLDFWVRE